MPGKFDSNSVSMNPLIVGDSIRRQWSSVRGRKVPKAVVPRV